MKQMTGLDFKILEMAARIRELRQIQNLTPEEMAVKTDVSTQEYLDCENGRSDLNFAFILLTNVKASCGFLVVKKKLKLEHLHISGKSDIFCTPATLPLYVL